MLIILTLPAADESISGIPDLIQKNTDSISYKNKKIKNQLNDIVNQILCILEFKIKVILPDVEVINPF